MLRFSQVVQSLDIYGSNRLAGIFIHRWWYRKFIRNCTWSWSDQSYPLMFRASLSPVNCDGGSRESFMSVAHAVSKLFRTCPAIVWAFFWTHLLWNISALHSTEAEIGAWLVLIEGRTRNGSFSFEGGSKFMIYEDNEMQLLQRIIHPSWVHGNNTSIAPPVLNRTGLESCQSRLWIKPGKMSRVIRLTHESSGQFNEFSDQHPTIYSYSVSIG